MKRIAVAAITRSRPAMFADLLASLRQLEAPADAELFFVFAENSETLSIASAVNELAAATGCPCYSVQEPRIGIPYARNAAMDVAVGHGADFLVFLDDDEHVPPEWLSRLWGGFKAADAQLVTGPVVPVAGERLTPMEKCVLAGLQKRARKVQREAERKLARGWASDIHAATNNWLCDLGFVAQKRLRFDESMGLSSGSDIKFWKDLKAAGGLSSWVSDAFVYETIPRSRLTLAYQFKRSRDQARSSWHVRKRPTGYRALIGVLPFVTGKLAIASFRLAVSVLDRGASLTSCVQALGMAAGRLDGALGRKSMHYRGIHGA